MNLKVHITGKTKDLEHPEQFKEIDRVLDGDAIICFALNEISESQTALGTAVIGGFSARDLSYILRSLKNEFGEEVFTAALLRVHLSRLLDDEITIPEEMQQ